MKNRNKPAFPIIDADGQEAHHGLTKREYIATKAMQGILSSMTSKAKAQSIIDMARESDLSAAEYVAEMALEYANALFTELELTSDKIK